MWDLTPVGTLSGPFSSINWLLLLSGQYYKAVDDCEDVSQVVIIGSPIASVLKVFL